MSNSYDVGYKKPPKNTQFKPGQTGNPKGRPKGTKNLATDLAEELAEKVLVTEGGKQRKTSKQRAMIKSTFAKAASGDMRAMSVVLRLLDRIDPQPTSDSSTDDLTPADAAVLETFKARVLAAAEDAAAAKDLEETDNE
jgi:hypothetical protein